MAASRLRFGLDGRTRLRVRRVASQNREGFHELSLGTLKIQYGDIAGQCFTYSDDVECGRMKTPRSVLVIWLAGVRPSVFICGKPECLLAVVLVCRN